jgi:DNA invertase Pin-like site-specific DNA recombinase
MSKVFAIYCRASTDGPDGLSSSHEEQEAAGRVWAEKEGIEVEVVSEVASGALGADDRELGRVIARCESGELAGIVVRDEKRFARDTIAGGVALDRLVECGARLKATWSGFDSENLNAESRMIFDIMMAIGKAERTRNRARRVNGSRKLALAGYYLASSAPLGYDLTDRREGKRGEPGVGKLVPSKKTAPLVEEVFRRRSEDRESYVSLAAWLTSQGFPMSKSGVRVMLQNRAYVGEATMPTEGGKRGEIEVIPQAHAPLVTHEQWERAQLDMPYHPRDARWSSQARVGGLAWCSGCGRRLAACGGGKGGGVAYYSCTAPNCTDRASIRMERLDNYVDTLLHDAFLNRDPHIVAIMEGDDRYQAALEEVEIARVELETWVTDMKVSEIGKDIWTQGKEARQGALDVARKALRSIPAPKPSRDFPVSEFTFEEAEPGLDREFKARFIDRIIVKSVGKGRRVPPSERADVWFIGAEEPAVRSEIVLSPGAITPIPADAKTIMADLEVLAAKGDQSARDYLAAKAEAAT